MPEDVTPNPMDPDAVAAHNAEIAAKQAAQDAAGKSNALKPGEFEDAATALDKIFLQQEPPPGQKPVEGTPAVTPKPTPEEEAAAKKAAEEKAAAEAAAAKAAEDLKKADEFFKDAPGLPPNASPKSSEAFNSIKTRAAQEILNRDNKIAELQKQVEDLNKRASTPTTEQLEQQKELSEMREWRAKLDLGFDPRFKDFDSKIKETEDFVYAQLRKSPAVTEDVINQIKGFGGPQKSVMTNLFAKINDPVLQRIVESKVGDIAMLEHQKQQALDATKANMTQYLKERETAYKNASIQHTTTTQSELNRLLGALPFMKDRPIEGDDAAKKSATDYNASVARVRGEITEALKDDSPQMRATLLTAYAKMCFLQDENASIKGELDALKKAHADVVEKYEAVKKASTSRLRTTNAPAAGITPKPATPSVSIRTEDALDNIARGIAEARAAAATK